MARWNISGDTVTLEPGPRRSLSRWLERYRLRIAVGLGLLEAVLALVMGFAGIMLPVALLSVLAYFWARKRVSPTVRRPLWILAVAQAIAGAAPAGVLVMAALGTVLLLILLLVLLGDLRR